MNNPDLLETVADYLRTELFPDIDPLSQRVLLGLYRLVAQGTPVTIDKLGTTLSINNGAVASILKSVEPSRLQFDEAGGIVAFTGLSQAPTNHRFVFGDRELYTWCAFDTLFLPQLLGGEARVSSTCPITKVKIQLAVTEAGPRFVEPSHAVMSFVMPDAKTRCGDLRGAFCNHVNFLASPEAGNTWAKRNAGTAIVSLDDAFDLGRARNEACFKDVLSRGANQVERRMSNGIGCK